MKEKINEILAKEGFVEKMLACEEPEQVQALFAAEGIELTIEEVKAIGRGLELASTEGDELSEDALDAVAGGVSSDTVNAIIDGISSAAKWVSNNWRRIKDFFRRW